MSLEDFNNDFDNENMDEDVEIDDASSNKSVLEGIRTSKVWKYFTRDENFKNNKKATCNICGITYICTGGSTSNLNKHIKKKHENEKMQDQSIKDIFKVVPKVNN